MARAFGKAVEAGREAFRSGMLEPRDVAVPSTPTIGRAVFS
jgi:thiazole synthase